LSCTPFCTKIPNPLTSHSLLKSLFHPQKVSFPLAFFPDDNPIVSSQMFCPTSIQFPFFLSKVSHRTTHTLPTQSVLASGPSPAVVFISLIPQEVWCPDPFSIPVTLPGVPPRLPPLVTFSGTLRQYWYPLPFPFATESDDLQRVLISLPAPVLFPATNSPDSSFSSAFLSCLTPNHTKDSQPRERRTMEEWTFPIHDVEGLTEPP